MKKEYTYYAFISYKREDEKWAKWLHKKLESYGFPAKLRKSNPSLPSKIEPVFRDKPELSGGNLKEEIENALSESKYLIVICSLRAAQSQWVSKEVQYFIDKGRTKFIIPFIIDGKPNAIKSEEECFPKGLRLLSGEKEILGININEMGREAAVVKVIARMFGVRFDTLWQRRERMKRRRNLLYILIAIFGVLVAAAMFYLRHEANKQANIAQENQIKAADERDNALALVAKQMIAEDSYGACLMALNLLERNPENVQAEAVLREAVCINNITLRGEYGWIRSLSFSSDGKFIASASGQIAQIWDLSTGACLKTLHFPYDVEDLYLLPDSDNLITITNKGIIYLYNLKSSKFVAQKQVINNIENTCLSKNGRRLAIADEDYNIIVLDTSTLSIEFSDKPTEDYLEIMLAFNNEGNILYYNDEIDCNNVVCGVNLDNSSKQIISFNEYNYEPDHIVFSDDNSQITMLSLSGTKIFDSDFKEIVEANDNFSTATYLTVSGVNAIITGDYDGNIKLWNAQNFSLFNTLPTKLNSFITDIYVHPTNRYIAYCGPQLNGNVNIIDLCYRAGRTNYPVSTTYNSGDDFRINCADLSTNEGSPILALSGYINAGEHSKTALKFLHYIKESNSFEEYSTDSVTKFNPTWIKISPSGKYLVGKDYNDLFVWNVEAGKLERNITLKDGINNFSFLSNKPNSLVVLTDKQMEIRDLSKDEDELLTDSYELADTLRNNFSHYALDIYHNLYFSQRDGNKLYKYDVINQVLRQLKFDSNAQYIIDILCSPTAEYILIRESNSKMTLYNTLKEEVISTWNINVSPEDDFKWHPSGRYILSSSKEGFTNVWEVRRGLCVLSIPVLLEDVSFSQDGQYIYGHLHDNYFAIYPFPSLVNLMNDVKNRFKSRKLSPLEKQIYNIY